MKLFYLYVKQRRNGILVFLFFCLIFLLSFILYHLPAAAVVYPALLCLFVGLIIIGLDFLQMRKKHQTLCDLQKLTAETIDALPPVRSVEDQDYQQIIRLLCQQYKEMENQMAVRYTDMEDYYTIWAHQIKTPIASMRLNLQNEDSTLSRKLSVDLLRIEQYVEMVLMFLRLDSDSSDYLIREYQIDSIVKQAVKKFSGEFISRKLRLVFEPLCVKVVTDEKWLAFVIEQILSNALKYTQTGSIRIFLDTPKILCIQDTGIGIAPEDLPRIFEKGYTGYNGRHDKRASGIGLYLCKRICRNLGHELSVVSALDQGTTVRIDLEQTPVGVE